MKRIIAVLSILVFVASGSAGTFAQRPVTILSANQAQPSNQDTSRATNHVLVPLTTSTPTPCSSGYGAWNTVAPATQDYQSAALTSDGNVAYSAGGLTSSTNRSLNQFSSYNPTTNVWTSLTPMPDTNDAAAAAYDPAANKVYVFGGENTGNYQVYTNTRIYDVANATWSVGSPLPAPRQGMAAGYYNGNIYLVGGASLSMAYSQTWEYNIASATYITKTQMPTTTGIAVAGSAVVSGHLYIAGGSDYQGFPRTFYDYDIANDTWAQRANLPYEEPGPGAANINGSFWIFGGGDPVYSRSQQGPPNIKPTIVTTSTLIYDASTDTWNSGPTLNQARTFLSGTGVGPYAVAVGGLDPNFHTLNTTEVSFNPPNACPTSTPTLTVTGTPPTATPTSTPSATMPPIATVTPTPPPCGLAWNVVSSPNVGSESNDLLGVTAISANDAWAVGYYRQGGGLYTIAQHWDGSNWSIVPTPNGGGFLAGVTSIASNNVWAVGGLGNATLVEHWDGTIWSVIPSPNKGSGFNGLFGVTALANNDIWAIGASGTNNDGTLIEHWDGTLWSIITTLSPSGTSALYGVAAASATDIWAVGSSGLLGSYQTLTEHWDGTSWSIIPSPNPATNDSLNGAGAVSNNDVWSVGRYGTGIIEQWNGTSWVVSNPPGSGNWNAVKVMSATDIWAVGSDIIHWDGVSWSLSLSTSGFLYGVAATSSDDIWAAGSYFNGTADQTLIEHHPGIQCTTATPTYTPVLPTGTPVPTTSTPTAANTLTPANTPVPSITPTTCPVPFVDISGDVFRGAITYLYCRGDVNGTDATHYSPTGTSTRGQFAKVVALGFGLSSYTPATPDFTDVQPAYFAYLYIESGFHAGILSGFDAASCTAHNAAYPCYLPNLPITRGQLTKLVVNAAHYPLFTPVSGQSFLDVPPSNVFFVSIETAHYKGVINGYSDGTFRPNNNIRRDEMAQIVFKGVITP